MTNMIIFLYLSSFSYPLHKNKNLRCVILIIHVCMNFRKLYETYLEFATIYICTYSISRYVWWDKNIWNTEK